MVPGPLNNCLMVENSIEYHLKGHYTEREKSVKCLYLSLLVCDESVSEQRRKGLALLHWFLSVSYAKITFQPLLIVCPSQRRFWKNAI